MEDLLRYILTNIVDNPKAIAIEKDEVDDSIKFTVTADDADMGKIIGKSGKTIMAIRNILKILAARNGKWVTVSVGDQ